MMHKGSGVTSEAGPSGGYCFDVEDIRNMVERAAVGFPPSHVPIWLMDLGNALGELESRYENGDHDGSANDLLHLRSHVLRCQREVVRYGKQHGYHPRTVAWFIKCE